MTFRLTQFLVRAWLVASVLIPVPALACSCGPLPPPCEAVGWSKLVFLGTVTELATTDRLKLAKMHVDHVYKGVLGATIDLFDDGMCDGPRLEIGRQYLIYTSPFAPGLVPSRGCTRSRAAEEAQEDLEFLTQYEFGNLTTHVSGTVRFRPDEPDDSRLGREGRPPLAGVDVVLSGKAGQLQTKSDSRGRYVFSGLPPGGYRMDARFAGYRLDWGPHEISLHPQGCLQADLRMKVDRRVQGVVRDLYGDPAVGALVEMRSTDPQLKSWQQAVLLDVSDDDGHYIIDGIPPGRYYLGINISHTPTKGHPYPPTYYPKGNTSASATPVTFGSEVSVQQIDLQVNDKLGLVEVQGRILNADGRPPRLEDHPAVRIKEPGLNGQIEDEEIQIDAEGRFHFQLCEGVGYSAFAFSTLQGTYSAPVEFVSTRENDKLELILDKTSEEFERLRPKD